MAHLSKQKIHDYYQHFSAELSQVGFAQDEDAFVAKMKKIKKQGYYLSQGEVDPNISGLSVPVNFSSKDAPLALTVVASKNRFEFINIDKLIEILKENAAHIEKRFLALSESHQLSHDSYSIGKK